MTEPSTCDLILASAERRARTGGYHGFSFREIADEIGVKSASIHYHFPAKEDLGAVLARRYADRFLERLGPPDAATPDERIARYKATFRAAVAEDGRMCLCGMFGAEITALPARVAEETRDFFARNLLWLAAVEARRGHGEDAAQARAATILAALEGAIILSRTMGDLAFFDRVADNLG